MDLDFSPKEFVHVPRNPNLKWIWTGGEISVSEKAQWLSQIATITPIHLHRKVDLETFVFSSEFSSNLNLRTETKTKFELQSQLFG